MNKLHCMIPTEDMAERIISELRSEGVSEDDLGVIGGHSARAQLLPVADVAETSDVKPALKKGAVVGGTAGLLAGLTAAVIPGGFVVGGAGLVGMTVGGGLFGAWASSLVGISVPSRALARFQDAIDRGELLLILNLRHIPQNKALAIITRHHPGVTFNVLQEHEASPA